MRSSTTRLLGSAALALVVACSNATSHEREGQTSSQVELAFDIWDWTPPARDPVLFDRWVADLARTGFNRVEMSVAWKQLETEPGQLDLSWLRERHAICLKHGMGMRLRINSYWMNAMPSWYHGDVWRDSKGKRAFLWPVPSISDEKFWKHYAPLCAAIARELRGSDIYYSPFIGIHAELKYADWWTFDESSMNCWRQAICKPRPEWLTRVVGDADLPSTPTLPSLTNGLPDTSPESRAFIAFREWTWRQAANRFAMAIREGDPDARISSPLGESFRRESAAFSNQDYFGLSTHAQQVVHSYDFALHKGDAPLWIAAATVHSFAGITRRPVCFEFDDSLGIEKNGYTVNIQKSLAQTVLDAGASGLKFANLSYHQTLPSKWAIIPHAAKLARQTRQSALPPRNQTLLLFMSKWATYCYREPTEWLHDAQFGWWKLLSDLQIPTRIICEDNLAEDLSGYRGIIVTFSPQRTMPDEDVAALDALPLKKIFDVRDVPEQRPDGPFPVDSPAGTVTVPGPLPFNAVTATGVSDTSGSMTLGLPLGYCYLHSHETIDQTREAAIRALQQVGISAVRK